MTTTRALCSLVVVVVVGVVALCGSLAAGEKVRRVVHANDESTHEYVGKFAYWTPDAKGDAPDSSYVGVMSFTAWTPSPAVPQLGRLLFYTEDEWTQARDAANCSAKVALGEAGPLLYNGITHTAHAFVAHQRPRFVYVAMSACSRVHGLAGLEIEVHFQQPAAAGKWVREFSWNEYGLLYVFLIGTLAYALVAAVWVYQLFFAERYRAVGVFQIQRLVTGIVVFETLAMLCKWIHYGSFALNGVGAPVLRGIAELIDLGCMLTLILVLLLIAKGWGSVPDSLLDAKVEAVLAALLALTYIAMFIWQEVGMHPDLVQYVYATPPGIVTLVIRGACTLYFMYGVLSLIRGEEEKRKNKFLFRFGIFFTLWFLSLPIVALCGVLLDPWAVNKVVVTLYQLTNFIGIIGLVVALHPSRISGAFEVFEPTSSIMGDAAHDDYGELPSAEPMPSSSSSSSSYPSSSLGSAPTVESIDGVSSARSSADSMSSFTATPQSAEYDQL